MRASSFPVTGHDACYAGLAAELVAQWTTFDPRAHKLIVRRRTSPAIRGRDAFPYLDFWIGSESSTRAENAAFKHFGFWVGKPAETRTGGWFLASADVRHLEREMPCQSE